MSLLVVIEDDARIEFEAAVERYETERSGLGGEFIDEMDRLIARILEDPEAGHTVRHASAKLRLRRRIAPRFPFTIVYRVEQDVVRIFAFAHMSRRPGYWRSRVRA